jgi:hypothetical protein
MDGFVGAEGVGEAFGQGGEGGAGFFGYAPGCG